MFNIEIKLLHNEENSFCTKIESVNFKITLTLAKLDMVCSRLVSNGLIFSDNVLVDIQLVTFFCSLILGNIGEKTRKS